MLVKNTIITLMAVAPAFTLPVTSTSKSTGTVATTKPPTTKPPTRVSKAAVANAEGAVLKDLAKEKKLRQELRGLDNTLSKDKTKARTLETQKLKQDKATAKLHKSKLTNATGRHTSHLSNHRSTHTGGSRNKLDLRIATGGRRGTGHSVTTPRSGLTTPRSGLTTPRSGLTTPGSVRSSLRTAVSPSQSPSAYGGFPTGFQSPGYGPPTSNRMSEDITFTPTTGGGYKESISWKPQARRLTRRAVTPTSPSAPLTPLEANTQTHKSRKSSKIHQHTVSEAMQLSAMLVEAEKLVNGLEGQMNKPQTTFANLKRKSKFKRPTTPITPATPSTPPPVKTT